MIWLMLLAEGQDKGRQDHLESACLHRGGSVESLDESPGERPFFDEGPVACVTVTEWNSEKEQGKTEMRETQSSPPVEKKKTEARVFEGAVLSGVIQVPLLLAFPQTRSTDTCHVPFKRPTSFFPSISPFPEVHLCCVYAAFTHWFCYSAFTAYLTS